MKHAFADSAYYIALLNPRDSLHALAHAVSRDFRGQVTTSEYVLVELANHFSARENRTMFSQFLKTLKSQPELDIVPASQDLFHEGMRLYEDRADKDWSLTDCISFVLMARNGIQEVLTADHHFEQAGFSVLLKR